MLIRMHKPVENSPDVKTGRRAPQGKNQPSPLAGRGTKFNAASRRKLQPLACRAPRRLFPAPLPPWRAWRAWRGNFVIMANFECRMPGGGQWELTANTPKGGAEGLATTNKATQKGSFDRMEGARTKNGGGNTAR